MFFNIKKIINFCFTYVSKCAFGRHVLAAVHFNSNLQQDPQVNNKTNQTRITVSYPKFKNGEAVVRDVKINPNFGKCKILSLLAPLP